MEHSFDIEIAQKYDIHTAILLKNLYFWIEKNRANGKHFYDGHYWTYNSKKAFSLLFSYMTERQIDYTINKMEKAGLIIKGNYNKIAYDRTCWYAITKLGYSILQNCEMEKPKLLNGKTEIVKPIPDINTDIKPNINTNKESSLAKSARQTSKKCKADEQKMQERKKESKPTFNDLIDNYTPNQNLRSELKEHLKTRKAKKATLTNRAIELSLKKLDGLADNDTEKILIVQKAIESGWTTFYPLTPDDKKHNKTGYNHNPYDGMTQDEIIAKLYG